MMDGTQSMDLGRQGTGAMRRTVYNLTGREIGEIIEGSMFAVPAGTPGGGPGTLVCSELVARELLRRRPQELSLSAGCYGPRDIQRMRTLPLEALQGFATELMQGIVERVEDFELRYATAAQAAARPPLKAGSAAGGKTA